MKNCRKIQQELSAYLDGELTPSLRADVERHLTSCAQCQQELSEMKTLATGVAALPNLEPAPRFLAEVRRKIARAEKPEPMSWQDYVFRPFWLKVPLEAAALIVIIGLAIRSEHPWLTQKVARLESAGTENRQNDRVNGVSSETAAKVTVFDALKTTSANQAPAMGALQGGPAAPLASAELSPEALEKKEKSVGAAESPRLTIAGDVKQQLADKSVPNEMPAGGANQTAAGSRRMPMVRNSDELSTTPTRTPSPVVGLVRSIELAQSKLSETVTVHASDFDEVRNRAQQLAARCSGRVVVVPQAKDAQEQTLFIELPQEYVAAFKLELLKTTGSSTVTARSGSAAQTGSTNTTVPLISVLTGSTVTNNSINAPGPFGLRDDAIAAAPNTVLEIRVIAPAN
jgi:Putative zinc-finger